MTGLKIESDDSTIEVVYMADPSLGTLVAWTNVPPTTLLSEFSLAQYWGVPPVTGNEEGVLVVGDFQPDGVSSFGVMYQNGNFYYRNDLAWNSGVYILQRVGAPIGTPITATTWR